MFFFFPPWQPWCPPLSIHSLLFCTARIHEKAKKKRNHERVKAYEWNAGCVSLKMSFSNVGITTFIYFPVSLLRFNQKRQELHLENIKKQNTFSMSWTLELARGAELKLLLIDSLSYLQRFLCVRAERYIHPLYNTNSQSHYCIKNGKDHRIWQ